MPCVPHSTDNRGKTYDASPFLPHHMPHGKLGAQEGSAQIGVDYSVPGVVRHSQKKGISVDAGVVYQNVDFAPFLSYLLHHGLHCFTVPNISFNGYGFPTRTAYALHHIISISLVAGLDRHIVDRHPGTEAGKLEGDGFAYATRGTGYERYLPF